MYKGNKGLNTSESVTPEEEKIKEILLQNGPLQQNFAGYYYDGINGEEACVKIEKQSIES